MTLVARDSARSATRLLRLQTQMQAQAPAAVFLETLRAFVKEDSWEDEGAQAFVTLVGTRAATSVSEIATASVVTPF